MFGLQVHAQVEFTLLEGAMLAVKTLNGLNMQGQSIKVTLPFSFFFLLRTPVTLQLCCRLLYLHHVCLCAPFLGPEACL